MSESEEDLNLLQLDGSSDKKKHKKKEKKEKKKKKKKSKKKWKKKNLDSDSSDDSSDESTKDEKEAEPVKVYTAPVKRDDWMLGLGGNDGFGNFSDNKWSFQRQAKEDKKEPSAIIEKAGPGQNSLELNPYWKDGGSGLPPEKEVEERAPRKSKFLRPGDSPPPSYYSRPISPSSSQEPARTSFGASTSSHNEIFPTSFGVERPPPPYVERTEEKQSAEPAPQMTRDEMNRLSARIMKAEMMDDKETVEKLKSQLEGARNALSAAEAEKKDNTLLLTKTDKYGNVRPMYKEELNKDNDKRQWNKKRKKAMDTHAAGMRKIYFADDNKYSLDDLVRQEKLGDTEDQEASMLKMASRKRCDDFEDEYLEGAVKHHDKNIEKRQRRAEKETIKRAQMLESCNKCLQNANKKLMIAVGEHSYLSLPYHTSLTEGHCFIVPSSHASSATTIDEDVWMEMQAFRKSLVRMYEKNDEDVIIMETSLKPGFHMALECVPVPREIGDLAPIYFKKAIMEAGPEWAQNKRVVDLAKGIRNSVPKGFPYFAVDFGLSSGYAHVVEDLNLFPTYFGREIVAGMMDLEPRFWRKPKPENTLQIEEKVDENRVIQIDIFSRVLLTSSELVGVSEESYRELFQLLETVVESYVKEDCKIKKSEFYFVRGTKVEASYQFVRRTAVQSFCFLSNFHNLSYCKDKLIVQTRPLTLEREDTIDFSNILKRPRTITGYFSNPSTIPSNLKSLAKKNKKKQEAFASVRKENSPLSLKTPFLKKSTSEKPKKSMSERAKSTIQKRKVDKSPGRPKRKTAKYADKETQTKQDIRKFLRQKSDVDVISKRHAKYQRSVAEAVCNNNKDKDCDTEEKVLRKSLRKKAICKTTKVEICNKTDLKAMPKDINPSFEADDPIKKPSQEKNTPRKTRNSAKSLVDGSMMSFEEAISNTNIIKMTKPNKTKSSVREKFNQLISSEIKRKDREKAKSKRDFLKSPMKGRQILNLKKLVSPEKSPIKLFHDPSVIKKSKEERLFEYLKALSGGAFLPNPNIEPYKPFLPHDMIFDEIEKVNSLIDLTKGQLIRFVNAEAIRKFIRKTIRGEKTCWRAIEFLECDDYDDSLMNKSIMDVLETDKNSIVTMEIMKNHREYAEKQGKNLLNLCNQVFVTEITVMMEMIRMKRCREITENEMWKSKLKGFDY
ncbi:DgyrCDS1311 [Dimorphilus gyrociliatus]|nr:DgyrCDS1311 [Dimorphilus gyrociliatus]